MPPTAQTSGLRGRLPGLIDRVALVVPNGQAGCQDLLAQLRAAMPAGLVLQLPPGPVALQYARSQFGDRYATVIPGEVSYTLGVDGHGGAFVNYPMDRDWSAAQADAAEARMGLLYQQLLDALAADPHARMVHALCAATTALTALAGVYRRGEGPDIIDYHQRATGAVLLTLAAAGQPSAALREVAAGLADGWTGTPADLVTAVAAIDAD